MFLCVCVCVLVCLLYSCVNLLCVTVESKFWGFHKDDLKNLLLFLYFVWMTMETSDECFAWIVDDFSFLGCDGVLFMAKMRIERKQWFLLPFECLWMRRGKNPTVFSSAVGKVLTRSCKLFMWNQLRWACLSFDFLNNFMQVCALSSREY